MHLLYPNNPLRPRQPDEQIAAELDAVRVRVWIAGFISCSSWSETGYIGGGLPREPSFAKLVFPDFRPDSGNARLSVRLRSGNGTACAGVARVFHQGLRQIAQDIGRLSYIETGAGFRRGRRHAAIPRRD